MELDDRNIARLYNILKYRICKNKSKIFKKIFSYIFLYVAFLCIFYDFAYNAWVCVKPIGLMLVILRTFAFWLLYILINHLVIKRILKVKILLIFESVLFLTLLNLFNCYSYLWNR